MRVDKREFTWEFHQLSCPGQTRTRVGCMRVDKREFTWEFHQLSCPGQTRARVAWELTNESLHKSFINSYMSWSNENKSCMRVDKREFTWEFHQLSCPGQTRTRVAWEMTNKSLHGSFINSHVLVKREQELHESWQTKVYMRVSSTLMSWSNENKSCMRVDKRVFTWEFHQLSCPGQTRTRVAWELTSESLHESFINWWRTWRKWRKVRRSSCLPSSKTSPWKQGVLLNWWRNHSRDRSAQPVRGKCRATFRLTATNSRSTTRCRSSDITIKSWLPEIYQHHSINTLLSMPRPNGNLGTSSTDTRGSFENGYLPVRHRTSLPILYPRYQHKVHLATAM